MRIAQLLLMLVMLVPTRTLWAADARARAESLAQLDALIIAGDWQAIQTLTQTLLADPHLDDPELQGELQATLEAASLRRLEVEHQQHRDPLRSARDYLHYAATFPHSPFHEQALYNALIYLQSGGQPAQALATGRQLLHDHPESRYTATVLAHLGFGEEQRADFAAAATHYETLATRFPQDPTTVDALYSAAIFREAQGDRAQATENYRRLAAFRPAVAAEGLARLAAPTPPPRTISPSFPEETALHSPEVRLTSARERLTHNPHDVDAYVILAAAHLARQEAGLARLCAQKALTLQSTNPDAWNELGRAARALTQDDPAEDAFRQALRHAPLHRAAQLNLGWLRLHQGQTTEAASLFSALLAVYPDDPDAKEGLRAAQHP